MSSGTIGLSNIYNTVAADVPVATLAGRTLTIQRQSLSGNVLFVQGEATVNPSGNTITIAYTFSDESDPTNILLDMCTATLTK